MWITTTTGEHTGELTYLLEWLADLPLCLRDQWISTLRLSDQRISAFSPKLQFLYCFSISMNTPLRPCIFLFVAGYRNLHTSGFFGNLLILTANGNMSFYSLAINYIFLFLATALNLLISSTSPAKSVYHTSASKNRWVYRVTKNTFPVQHYRHIQPILEQ